MTDPKQIAELRGLASLLRHNAHPMAQPNATVIERYMRKAAEALLASAEREVRYREGLAAVRACRIPAEKGMSIHGPYECGPSWNITGLTKLLPRIDALLAEPADGEGV